MLPVVKAVSNQPASIYKLLSKSAKPLTAAKIAEELSIMPNAVYRAVKRLVALGMVTEIDSYPVSYRAVESSSAINWYLQIAAQNFRNDFVDKTAVSEIKPRGPNMTFIKDRQSLLKISEQEIRASRKSVNYIVSGHTIPDSSVLAFRKAFTLGVKVRAIIQNTPKTTNNPIENYRGLGVEVRYLPNIGIRLFVFDGKSAIMTSYDITQSSRDFGIRFNYQAVAKQLDELFEQRWQEAKELN